MVSEFAMSNRKNAKDRKRFLEPFEWLMIFCVCSVFQRRIKSGISLLSNRMCCCFLLYASLLMSKFKCCVLLLSYVRFLIFLSFTCLPACPLARFLAFLECIQCSVFIIFLSFYCVTNVKMCRRQVSFKFIKMYTYFVHKCLNILIIFLA